MPPLDPSAEFEQRLAELGIELESGELETLGRYLALLMVTNRVINLTAIDDAAEAWTRHVLDSLTLLPVLAEAEPEAGRDRLRVLDVGSGGGLPGLVLAIAMPDADFTLLDATAKKCRFLQHAASELALTNVDVACARAEAAGHERGERVDRGGVARREGAMRGAFDVVTARAVGRLATLAELTVPFARVGGLCVLVKGAKAEEELEEARAGLHLLHASHAGTVETPTGRIVVLEKRRATPRDYPRADGQPKRSPLGIEKD
ncbi:MAG: 16S rRNA (guanine(527)-N(7))-methyltransferase RsmG [Planctomycetota bacterium]